MKKFMFLFLGLTLLTFLGCEQDSTGVDNLEAENESAIRTILEDSTDIFFDAIDDESEDNFLSDDPNWLGQSSLAKTTEIKTRFGRIGKRPIERTIQIVFDTDTTATAYIYTKLKGKFVVRKVEFGEDTVIINRYEKPMIHEIERIVHLKKFRETQYLRLNWKITDISMANGESVDKGVEIVELTVMPAGMDTVVITDPLNYFQSGATVFSFPRWMVVKLRVKVKNTTTNPIIYPEGTEATENVRLHYGRNRCGHFGRSPFEWVGKDEMDNNIYEGTWTVRQFRGMHHAVIDVIDNGTILDSDNQSYPYVSNTWASPYRVTFF